MVVTSVGIPVVLTPVVCDIVVVTILPVTLSVVVKVFSVVGDMVEKIGLLVVGARVEVDTIEIVV